MITLIIYVYSSPFSKTFVNKILSSNVVLDFEDINIYFVMRKSALPTSPHIFPKET